MRLSAKCRLLALPVLILVLTTATSSAAASPATRSKTIASYCSSSGDVCYGIFNRSGKVYLRITTAARYFKRYKLCVRLLPPGSDGSHAQRCGSFPVFRQGGSTWGSSVNYARQYPVTDPGRYRVSWKLGPSPLGPPLQFRLPLSRTG
ncbi:MAG TPA: hypothetical protein VNB58_03615 [Gaiellaceae bacterium]|jgi:hypothetical protein|nr:hypothetical protein [Gaiellaceae bacterium]